jgi:hypothetical protein
MKSTELTDQIESKERVIIQSSGLLRVLSVNKFWILFGIVILGHLFFVYWANTPPHWDAGRHLHNVSRYFVFFKEIIKNTGNDGNRLNNLSMLVGNYYYYAPFAYYLTFPFLLLFGLSYKSVLIANIIWLSLIFWGTKKWLELMNVNKNIIFIIELFLFSSPFIIGNSRELQQDIPILAMSILSILMLEKLARDLSYKNIILASLVISLAFLTKWNFIIYFFAIIPLYIVRIISLNNFKSNLKFVQASLYIAITSFAGICFWYLNNLGQLYYDLTKNGNQQGIDEGDPQGITLASLNFFIDVIVNNHFRLLWIGLLGFIILSVIFGLIRSKDKLILGFNKNYLFYFGLYSFVSMLLVHMKQGNKDTRYVVIFYISYIPLITVLLNLFTKYQGNRGIAFIKYIAIAIFLVQFGLFTYPFIQRSNIDYSIKSGAKSYTILNSSGYTYEGNIFADYAIIPMLKFIK